METKVMDEVNRNNKVVLVYDRICNTSEAGHAGKRQLLPRKE